jgi:hypothetical protein
MHSYIPTSISRLATLASLALVLAAGCRDRPVAKPPVAPANGPQSVQLVVDYGDGMEKRFPAIAWRSGMTVLDALEAAKVQPHGIAFSARGSGETALVTKIDDVENQQGAGEGTNWLFYVNDQLADKSCGAATVKPGDSILWKFQVKE